MFAFVTEIIGAVIGLEIGERLFGTGRRAAQPAVASQNTRVLLRRFCAFLTDMALVFAGCYLVLGIGRLGPSLSLLVAFAIFLLYRMAFEASIGRTPAKALFGIRVVGTTYLSAGSVGASPAVTRNLLLPIDLALISSVVGLMIPLATARNQRVGDLLAGTMVVAEDSRRHARQARGGVTGAHRPLRERPQNTRPHAGPKTDR